MPIKLEAGPVGQGERAIVKNLYTFPQKGRGRLPMFAGIVSDVGQVIEMTAHGELSRLGGGGRLQGSSQRSFVDGALRRQTSSH
jgi:hypothetical protein